MNSVHAIMIVMIRLWAAALIVPALSAIPLYAGFFFTDGKNLDPYAATAVGQHIFLLLTGGAAWFAAPWFAKRIPVNSGNENTTANISAEVLVTAGSFLIGVYYLVQYLPGLVSDLGWWFVELNRNNTIFELEIQRPRRHMIEWRSTFSNFLVVCVAMWMTFRLAYLAKIFNWLRSAGHYEESDKEKIS